MITPKEREMLLAFIAKHADGDTLIQTANRISNNLTDIETLRQYIETYKGANACRRLREQCSCHKTKTDRILSDPPIIDNPEDLGEAPKKLGSNGQSIEKLMARNPDVEYSVDGLKQALHIPVATKSNRCWRSSSNAGAWCAQATLPTGSS
jgi:hypothetical protein